jgi:hypothetical protein
MGHDKERRAMSGCAVCVSSIRSLPMLVTVGVFLTGDDSVRPRRGPTSLQIVARVDCPAGGTV